MKKLWLVCCFCVLYSSGVWAQDKHYVKSCLAKDSAWSADEHILRMKKLGINCATVYYNLMSYENRHKPYQWVKQKYLDSGYDVILVLKFDEIKSVTGGVLQQIIDGNFDKDLHKLISEIVSADKPIVVRPLHEIDASWHPWGMYAKGNSQELAVKAVEHIVTLFRQANAPVKIDINFNRKDGRGKVLGEAEQYMPQLNKLVDSFSVSTYNRCKTAPNYPSERSFAEDFRPVYQRLQSFTQKPINVAETSTSGLCGSRIPWFEKLFSTLDTEFAQVESVTFFFGDKPVGTASNTVPIHWGLDSDEEREQFRQLVIKHQSADQVVIDLEKIAGFNSGFRAPWSLSAKITNLFYEIPNQAINPVTGNEFGRQGFVFTSQFTQRLLFPINSNLEFGPALHLGILESPNDNQWWNNLLSSSLGFGLYGKLPQDLVQWGSWSIEPYVEYREYTTQVPDRFQGSGEPRVGVTAGFTFGGDWKK
ncbi:MAG: hypothetical protein RLZZ230_848 [Candidatus Parcubacteria bacterium]|jgi:hypothetical protein